MSFFNWNTQLLNFLMPNSYSAIFPHQSCRLRFCIQNVFMIVNHFNSPPSLPMFPSVTVVLFCMAALIFPMGFYIKEVGGQPYKLPNNTVVGSSYVLFVLSIFFTIVGLLFAGKVCLPGWHALLLLLLFHHLLFLYIWRKSCSTWLIRGRAALFELNKTEGQLFLGFFFSITCEKSRCSWHEVKSQSSAHPSDSFRDVKTWTGVLHHPFWTMCVEKQQNTTTNGLKYPEFEGGLVIFTVMQTLNDPLTLSAKTNKTDSRPGSGWSTRVSAGFLHDTRSHSTLWSAHRSFTSCRTVFICFTLVLSPLLRYFVWKWSNSSQFWCRLFSGSLCLNELLNLNRCSFCLTWKKNHQISTPVYHRR